MPKTKIAKNNSHATLGDKWIPWPGIGQVNKKSIAPIVDNHYFRRLSDKRQLAFTYLVFPGATHDRRQHSMGAYFRTCQFTAKMVGLGLLNNYEAINLNLYALIHDIGHGPLSHVIEVFTKSNHHRNRLGILDKIAKRDERQRLDNQDIQMEAGSILPPPPGTNWKSYRRSQHEKIRQTTVPF